MNEIEMGRQGPKVALAGELSVPQEEKWLPLATTDRYLPTWVCGEATFSDPSGVMQHR